MTLFHHHLNKSLAILVGYYGFRSKYSYSREVYSQLLNVDSFQENKAQAILNPPRRIVVRNLFFADQSRVIFQDLNLTIEPNTIICGPSGSGKTVLYKLIVGKLATPGRPILFDDLPTGELNPAGFRDLCIYQPSNGYLSWQGFGFFGELPALLREQILEICRLVNLDPLSGNLQPDRLSSGQRQLLNLLSLLPCKNKVLILDEAASHINNEARMMVYKHLIPFLSEGNFVICSEHTPEVCQFFRHRIDLC